MYISSSLNKFAVEIENYKSAGDYSYNFDSNGNVVLRSNPTSFSECYLSIPVNDQIYDDNAIDQLYTTDFEELKPLTIQSGTNADESVIKLNSKIYQLESIIKDLTVKSTESNKASSQLLANKSEIIKLRIELGQGSKESDFNSTFPYLPLKVT